MWDWINCCSGCQDGAARIEPIDPLGGEGHGTRDADSLAKVKQKQIGVSESSDDDETVDALPPNYTASDALLARRRLAVSSPPMVLPVSHMESMRGSEFVSKKSKEETDWIKDALLKELFFSALDRGDVDRLIFGFDQLSVDAGRTLIQQGDVGRDMYVLVSGSMDVFVTASGHAGPGKKVAKYSESGTIIGMLALLHNAPRAATVVASERCALWCLKGELFSRVVQFAAAERRQEHMELLKQVKLLKALDDFQIGEVADALVSLELKKGELVCKAGDEGDCFFMVQDGEATAVINGFNARVYKRGGYFGELSLLNDRPRAADVVASSEKVNLVSLDRVSFRRILGDTALFKEGQEKPKKEVQTTNASNEQRNSVGKKKVAFGDESSDTTTVRTKRGSGFVSKEQLKQMLMEAKDSDGDDMPGVTFSASSELPERKHKSRTDDRKGTGFIKADALMKLIAENDDDDDEDIDDGKGVQFDDNAKNTDGSGNKRRNTGFVNAAALEAMLDDDDEEDEDDDQVTFTGSSKSKDGSGPSKRNTGFVSTVELKAMLDEQGRGSRHSAGEVYVPHVEPDSD